MKVAKTLVIAIVVLLAGSPAVAQRDSEAPKVALDVRLQRIWFSKGTPLSVEIDVANRSKADLRDLRVSLALFERVRSRSELRRAYDGRLPRTPLQALTHPIEDLRPGTEQRVTISEDFAAQRSFQGAPDGLYPLAVTVRQTTGPTLSTTITAAALVNEPPGTPLGLVTVLAVAPPPILSPIATPTDDTRAALLDLRKRLTGLPEPGSPLGFTVSPFLLDELRSLRATPLRAEAAAVEDAIRQLASGAQLLVVPYAFADLTQLSDLAGGGSIDAQIDVGRAVLKRALGVDPLPMLYPPGLHVDEDTLERMRRAGIGTVVVPGAAVSSLARGLTPAEPASSEGVDLLPADELLKASIEGAGSDAAIDRAAVETAMVYFESPARERLLVVAAEVDGKTSRFAAFLQAIRGAPWLKAVTPSAAAGAQTRALRSIREPEESRPPRAFVDALGRSRRAVADFSSFTMTENPVIAALRASLEAATGTAWWQQEWEAGVAWNRDIVESVDEQRRLVSAAKARSVTFTSRRGEIPVTVVNKASYPVRVRVDVSSRKLEFPEGSSKVLDPLEPPGETVTFAAFAEATGTFPLRVRVTSPDGAVEVSAPVEYVVRSTAFNRLALVITVGAGVFLVGWYLRRFLLTRRRKTAA